MNIQEEIADLCPTRCISWNESTKEMKINNKECSRCMHCINKMPKALAPGKVRGASLLMGGKAPILKGAMMSWVMIPFFEMKPPYQEIKDLAEKVWDWWDENGKMRERLGELIERVGMRVFLKAMGIKPIPQMIQTPRANPYYFWWPEEVPPRKAAK
jgi:sulfite reductase alpha subunit